MVLPPGEGLDLDALVAEAIQRGDTNPVVPERPFWGDREMPLAVITTIRGRLDLTRRLFEAGVTITADDAACILWWWEDVEVVAFLRRFGVPFDADCLEVAVRHEKWDVVLFLLDDGAPLSALLHTTIYQRPIMRLSLLHAAAWNGNSLVVRDLLRRGMAADERDSQDMTPLMAACRGWRNESGADCAFYLLEAGANPNAATPTGETPLLLCTGERCEDKGFSPYYRRRMAKLLLDYGGDPNVVSPLGTTPLMFAARDNDAPLARALLDAGANPAARTPDGLTALDAALRRDSHEVAELLRNRH